MTAIPDGYYALLNPNNPTAMTYWRARSGTLTAWPARARYAPTLLKRDVPEGLRGRERYEWANRWYAEHARPWHTALQAALAADPDGSRARFAALTTRCAECARRLTDDKSKLLGFGPDCRRALRLDDAVLTASVTPLIAAAHAEQDAAATTAPTTHGRDPVPARTPHKETP